MKVFQQLTSTILKPAIISTALLFASFNTHSATYTYSQFGANSTANGINNVGQVVGASIFNGNSTATLWNGTTATNLGTLGGSTSQAIAINNSGKIVGTSKVSDNIVSHAVLWNGTNATDLESLGNSYLSTPTSINEVDQIVGRAMLIFRSPPPDGPNIRQGPSTAVVWNNGIETPLSALGVNLSNATGINEIGQIAGQSNNSATRVALGSNGTLTDLRTLGDFSSANSINNAGQVVGYTSLANDNTYRHATLWDEGIITDLGNLNPNGGTSEANSINNLGQIVGNSDGHGFLWENGVMTDLNSLVNLSLGLTIINAKGINDFGWIVGDVHDFNTNTYYGYLLSAPSNVPVPAAAWLFASGLGAFGMTKRRSKKT
jgi:probable HAF family extracellular repeat protein